MGDRAPITAHRDPRDPEEVLHRANGVGEVRDLRQLRLFQAVAQSGSFTEAAAIMSVTQSAVSHSIKSLESTLGMRLFDRSGKVPCLTKDGEIFLASASEVLREMGRLSQKLDRSRTGELMTLRIGCTDTLAEFVLPEVLVKIDEEFPDADLSLAIDETTGLAPGLKAGSIDILLGVQSSTTPMRAFQHANLFKDSLRIIVAPGHPWLTSQTSMEAESLKGERLLLFGEQSSTNQLVRQWFDRCGIRVDQCIEIGSMGALKRLVACGFGIGLAPEWALDASERQQLLPDLRPAREPIHRDWCISMRKTHQFSTLEKRFIVLLKEATAALQ